VERQAGVDDVLDEEHVTIGEWDVDVLQQAHSSATGTRIRGELDDVERVRNRKLTGEIGEEDDARLERCNQERVETAIVGGDLRPELGDTRGDLATREVDGADLTVLRLEGAGSHRLGGEAQSVALREALDIATIEELDPDVRIQPAQLPQLPILSSHERLFHHRHLDEEILLREIEVGRERAYDAALLVSVQDEGVRLVIPGDAVVVEDLRALELDAIREARRLRSAICLENGTFDPHLRQGSNRLGRLGRRVLLTCPAGMRPMTTS
jgi:hypothetical protein